jgi:hypothetical protein
MSSGQHAAISFTSLWAWLSLRLFRNRISVDSKTMGGRQAGFNPTEPQGPTGQAASEKWLLQNSAGDRFERIVVAKKFRCVYFTRTVKLTITRAEDNLENCEY